MNRIRRSEPTDVPDNKPAAEITADAIASGRGGFWRSLDELADTEAYRIFAEK
jgi:hypothetical protein